MWGVAVLPVFRILVSFVLQEQPTNLNVALFTRPMQRGPENAEYRESKRAKCSKYSECFFKNVWGMAALPVFWIHVSIGLQEQPTNFNVTIARRMMQRSLIIAEYRESKRAKQNKHSEWFFKNVWGMAVLLVFWIHVSFELHKEPTNFNVTTERRQMQRSPTTAE